MPIYEYICANCGQEVEVIQKFSDEPLKECSVCKHLSLEKKTSVSAFHLKGGGWYRDGYGSSKSSAAPDSSAKKNKVASENKASKNKDSKSAETEAKNKTAPSSKAS